MDSRTLTASRWAQFLSHAENLLQCGSENQYTNSKFEIPLSAWRDELARLRIWAKEVDIQNQNPGLSLDERLCNLPFVKDQIFRQLTRIQRLFKDLEDVLGGPKGVELQTDSDSEDDERKEEEGQPRTVIQDIYMHLEDSINGLNRMSLIIAQRADSDMVPETNAEKEPAHRAEEEHLVQEPKNRASYSYTHGLWICCQCGDGPKYYSNQVACWECHHYSCPNCTLVK